MRFGVADVEGEEHGRDDTRSSHPGLPCGTIRLTCLRPPVPVPQETLRCRLPPDEKFFVNQGVVSSRSDMSQLPAAPAQEHL